MSEPWEDVAREDHRTRCEERGPEPQAPSENCPFRADHAERGRAEVERREGR